MRKQNYLNLLFSLFLFSGSHFGFAQSDYSWQPTTCGQGANALLQTDYFNGNWDSTRVFAGGASGVYMITVGGADVWEPRNVGLPIETAGAVLSLYGTPQFEMKRLWAGTEKGGVYYSDDYGAQWIAAAGLPDNFEAKDMTTSNGYLYVGGTIGVYRTLIEGAPEWKALTEGLPANRIVLNLSTIMDASQNSRVICATRRDDLLPDVNVFVLDSSNVWTAPLQTGLPEHKTIAATALYEGQFGFALGRDVAFNIGSDVMTAGAGIYSFADTGWTNTQSGFAGQVNQITDRSLGCGLEILIAAQGGVFSTMNATTPEPYGHDFPSDETALAVVGSWNAVFAGTATQIYQLRAVTSVDKRTPAQTIRLFPNPVADGNLRLIYPATKTPARYTILDMKGDLRLAGEVSESLDVSTLSAGVYVLKINETVKKFIVE